tara:strand:- start:2972 stop:3214 length:243 start_codon:yes stop_codon:yes gene_type:complete
MAEETQQLSAEQTADLVNKLVAENKTFRAMLNDTAEKIAQLELKNSELKVQNRALQEVLQASSGTTTPVEEPAEVKSEEE